jgi:hypothetical protein
MGAQLLTEQDTVEIRNIVVEEGKRRFPEADRLTVFFEHGHWWLIVFSDHEYTYDVVDANTDSGIDFELVDFKELD